MDTYNHQEELSEAIAAGERAIQSLQEAQAKMNSARNWGLLDLIGGGIFSGFMKHAKINDASVYIEQAKRDLSTFSDELNDVRDIEQLNVDVDGFLTFADFFFDGLIADFFVQSRINEGQEQISQAIIKVQNILARLRNA